MIRGEKNRYIHDPRVVIPESGEGQLNSRAQFGGKERHVRFNCSCGGLGERGIALGVWLEVGKRRAQKKGKACFTFASKGQQDTGVEKTFPP